MNTSYKVALISAIVLCAALLGYYATSGQSDEPAVNPAAPAGPGRPEADVAVVSPPPDRPARAAAPAPSPTVEPLRATPPSTPAPTPAPAVITPPAPTTGPPTIVFDGTPPELQPQTTPPPSPAAPTAVATPPTSTARPLTTAYTIRPGDTLISIAEAHYGSQNYWDEIAQANPMIDPIRLKPGDVIQLPQRDAIDRRPPAPTPRGDGTVIHIVRPGQTLSHIAQEHYDDPTLWRAIYLNNRELIGSNPNRLAAGTRLEIPPKP